MRNPGTDVPARPPSAEDAASHALAPAHPHVYGVHMSELSALLDRHVGEAMWPLVGEYHEPAYHLANA